MDLFGELFLDIAMRAAEEGVVGVLHADVAEVLADFAEISRGGSVGMDPTEIEEDAYMELVEFLRVGVQLVYDELHTQRPPGTGPATRH